MRLLGTRRSHRLGLLSRSEDWAAAASRRPCMASIFIGRLLAAPAGGSPVGSDRFCDSSALDDVEQQSRSPAMASSTVPELNQENQRLAEDTIAQLSTLNWALSELVRTL